MKKNSYIVVTVSENGKYYAYMIKHHNSNNLLNIASIKGITYKVKLVMSDEYIIEAHNKGEAEQIERDKFGNDYLIDDVIITEME